MSDVLDTLLDPKEFIISVQRRAVADELLFTVARYDTKTRVEFVVLARSLWRLGDLRRELLARELGHAIVDLLAPLPPPCENDGESTGVKNGKGTAIAGVPLPSAERR